MKIDVIKDNENDVSLTGSNKGEDLKKSRLSGNSILDLLNPLKSINVNSELHSFYNFRESKMSVEALLKAQTNLVFYVLHQNFMCDNEHKEFFKNMVGRFYDIPEKFWGYYRGMKYINEGDLETLSGLVLLENKYLYEKRINGINNVLVYRFKAENTPTKQKYFFNRHTLIHLHGIKSSESAYTQYYYPLNTKKIESKFGMYWGFINDYEYGRFDNNKQFINTNSTHGSENLWYKFSLGELESLNKVSEIQDILRKKSTYASVGIDNMDALIKLCKECANRINEDFKDEWILKFNNEDTKLVRSLCQNFSWTKEYIFQNEEKLNLDVLGLNMTVPWDFDLVKFFVKRGYGGRMSENKAVFDKVFEPLLTDEIIEMLFKLEFEKF